MTPLLFVAIFATQTAICFAAWPLPLKRFSIVMFALMLLQILWETVGRRSAQ